MSEIIEQSIKDRECISGVLNIARNHGLEVEVIYDALLTMKEDSTLGIGEAMKQGLYEWVK